MVGKWLGNQHPSTFSQPFPNPFPTWRSHEKPSASLKLRWLMIQWPFQLRRHPWFWGRERGMEFIQSSHKSHTFPSINQIQWPFWWLNDLQLRSIKPTMIINQPPFYESPEFLTRVPSPSGRPQLAIKPRWSHSTRSPKESCGNSAWNHLEISGKGVGVMDDHSTKNIQDGFKLVCHEWLYLIYLIFGDVMVEITIIHHIFSSFVQVTIFRFT